MKTLNTLIRLHKRTLDELRREMVSLENQKTKLQEATVSLQKELESEVALAGKQVEMASFFGEFAKRIKNRQEELRAEIRAIDAKITKLNEDIFVAFTELKKIEIAKQNALERKKAAENRKETIMLDEIASQQYTRRNQP